MSNKIVITAAGNTIFGDEDIVASAIGKNILFKHVKDLNVGELVCYDAQYIDKMLEDIEPDLYSDSARYRAAKDSLHIDGQTALSYYLNNSLLLKGLGENEKIDKLHDFIGKKVVKETVKKWLSGETVMPEPENLGLIADIHPELKDFYEGFQKKQEGLAYPLYDLYNNVRRGLAHYLAKPKGLGTGEKKEVSTPLESITLAPEIDIVVKRYFNKISDKMNSVRITGIKELERKEALKMSSSENYEKLKKGVVRFKPDEKQKFLEKNELSETTLLDTINDSQSLSFVLGKYTKKLLKEKLDIDFLNERESLGVLGNKIRKSLPERFGFLWETRNFGKKQHTKEAIELTSLLEKDFENCYHNLEDKMSIEEQITIEKMLGVVEKILYTMPSTFLSLKEYLSRQWKANDEFVLTGRFINTSEREYKKMIQKVKVLKKELKDAYDFDTENIPKMKEFPEASKYNKGTIPLTDEDGKVVLKKYGMEELIPKIFG